MSFKDLPINELINVDFNCSCGHHHEARIDHIAIGKGAVNQITDFLEDQKLHDGSKLQKGDRLYLIADVNTWEVAGKKVANLIEKAGYPVTTHIFPYKSMHAEQKYADEIAANMPKDTKMIIAVGSGTINDLSRFVAFNHDMPYYIVGTAPSMDGYTSNVSPLVQNNIKITHSAECASAVIGDTDILATAPDIMIAAGLGDIMGKYLAINDWKLSHMINDEYYCPEVGDLVLYSVQKCVDSVPGLAKRESESLQYLMESLVLIGIAMSFIGFSRPASASEHHISHFLEMKSIQKGEYGELHGTNVGMATGLVGEMYGLLLNKKFDYDRARAHAKAFDYDAWEKEIHRTFGPGAGEVIKLYTTARQNDPDKVLARLDAIEKNEDAMRAQIAIAVEQTKKTPQLLKQLGGLTDPKDFGFDKAEFSDILHYAKDLRDRYAALQIFYDLDELDDLIKTVTDKYFG